MTELIVAVRDSVAARNWYSALATTLTLPDIAAKLDGRQGGSAARYISWFGTYLDPTYTVHMGDETVVFLSGEDCYALRCAFLHEGDFDISGQMVRKALTSFTFIVPPPGMTLHNISSGSRLALQVDCFCEDVCEAVETWLNQRGNDPVVRAAIADMARIKIIKPGEGFSLP
ncbi:MAG: hypothetical protein A3H97_05110 [Acidobacteria bacterium RIFCSPLOWO2_02_FULL_65_29]|nr:MAG: hypothetical protein A3H97_05110 [Acidobacteria bacterium RIFCSPLOWO2_02_FULL_65_29]